MLDSDHFKWLLEPSISALWTVFALIWGTGSAGLMYYALVWTIEALSVTKVDGTGWKSWTENQKRFYKCTKIMTILTIINVHKIMF